MTSLSAAHQTDQLAYFDFYMQHIADNQDRIHNMLPAAVHAAC